MRALIVYSLLILMPLTGCMPRGGRGDTNNSVSSLIDQVGGAVVAIGTVWKKPDGTVGFKIIGTGFNVDPSGIVITCEHIVRAHLQKYTDYAVHAPSDTTKRTVFYYNQDQELVVLFRGYVGTPHKVETVALLTKTAFQVMADKNLDIAILKLDGIKPLPHVEIGDSDFARIGERVIISGYPFGEKLFGSWGVVQPTFSQGTISAIHPFDQVPAGGREFLQLDIHANPGSSGGPVIPTTTGKAVGIVKAGVGKETGITLAIPVNSAQELIQLIKNTTHEDIIKGQAPFSIEELKQKGK